MTSAFISETRLPRDQHPQGTITAAQLFAVRQLESAFKKSGDATLQAIDVKSFVDAAMGSFPTRFRYLVVTRFVLTTVGSVFVIVLLALPPASVYFES